MDWVEFFQTLKEAADTKTAMVLVALAAFYLGSRLQKKLEEYATKKDFEEHKKTILKENLMIKDDVRTDLSGFNTRLGKHEDEDKQKFSALDEKQTSSFGNVYKQLNASRRSLARIEGALNIPPEKETDL